MLYSENGPIPAERKNMAVRWMGLRFFYHLPIQKIRRENVQYYKNKKHQISQQSPAVLSSVGFLCNYFRFPSLFLVFNDPFCHVTSFCDFSLPLSRCHLSPTWFWFKAQAGLRPQQISHMGLSKAI